MTRDRVQSALRRVHSGALANTELEVYEPTIQYEQGVGYTVSYPDTPTTTLDARVESPSDDVERTVYGTTGEIDADVRVRDDTGQQWRGFGEETEAPAQVVDVDTGVRYEIQSVVEQHSGLTRLGAVEV